MKVTNVFYKNIDALKKRKKIIINYGGSSSSKTVSVMQLFRLIAETRPNYYFLLIARSVPKLETTLLPAFKEFVMAGDYNHANYNEQKKIYKFANGSVFKFANAYEPDTYRGVRSHYAILDEINTYRNSFETFKQIYIRCKFAIFPTFNPSSKFWITDYFGDENATVIHSTYKDNRFLEKNIIENLEQTIKYDENFYNVYVKGEWGALSGLVFKFKQNWDYFENLPENYDIVYYGLDFGFANSKTAAVKCYVDFTRKSVYVYELIYAVGLLNSQIAEIIKPELGDNYIVCDSAEPKSITSLRNEYGILAISAAKGVDSVKHGLQKMKEWQIFVHVASKNFINEFFNYKYIDGKEVTNIPEKKDDHLIDALRYIFLKFKL